MLYNKALARGFGSWFVGNGDEVVMRGIWKDLCGRRIRDCVTGILFPFDNIL